MGGLRTLLAGWLALAALLLGGSPAVADDVAGSLDGLQLRGDTIEALLTSSNLSAGASIDPSTVTVTVGGQEVEATGEPAGAGTVTRRAVLLVDVSGSMRGTGIDAAKHAASAFLDAVPPDVEVGLVVFNDTAQVLAEPTRDRAAVRAHVDSLTATRETALYDAIPVALQSLGTAGDRTLVVLSDGGDTVSLNTKDTAVQAMAGSGVRVEAVGFRTDESQDQVLADLAAAGHGRVAQAGNSEALAAVFAQAAQTLTRQIRVAAERPADVSGDVEIRVTALAGGGSVVATSTVSLPEKPAAPAAGTEDDAATPLAPAGTRVMNVPGLLASPWPPAALVGLFLLVTTLLIASPLLQPASKRRAQRIELYSMQGRKVRARDALQQASPHQMAQPFLHAAEQFVQWRGLATGWALKLDRADMSLRPHEWLVLRIAASLAALAVGAVLGAGWFWSIVWGVLAWVATGLYVKIKAERRLAKFAAQLPDALNLVASSISTGFSLPQALDAVARDTSDPMRVEIGRALAEARLGMDLELALGRTAYRMRNQDLRWAVMAIQVQRQVGGNLAETLRTTVATLRERSMLRRHVKALSAEGRLSAYILIGLPIAITAWLYISNREYISLLWSNVLGWIMIVVALVGMVIGTLWMRKVVKVEV
ncbi:MAG: type II secretion system F family protein [Actinomycetota bacterium]